MRTPREINGRWWLPTSPDDVMSGRLTAIPAEQLQLATRRLRTFSLHEILAHGHESKSDRAHEVILGADEGSRPITLLGCFQTRKNHTTGLLEESYICQRALLGRHVASARDFRCTEIEAEFTNLEQWLSISSIQPLPAEMERIGFLVNPGTEPQFPLADGTELAVRTSISSRSSHYRRSECCISEKHFFVLKFPRPLSLNEVMARLTQLGWFLSLMMAQPIHLTRLAVTEQEAGHGGEVEILGPELHEPSEESPPPERMLLGFDDVRSDFGQLLDRWLAYFDKIEPVLELYFSVVFNPQLYASHQFLFLAQALEVYHRLFFPGEILPRAEFRAKVRSFFSEQPLSERKWLKEKLQHANEKRLADRISEIFAQHEREARRFISDLPSFAEKVRHTRNYYTHFSPELLRRGKVADDSELFLLAHQLQRLLELCFLKDLEIRGAPIERVLRRRLPEAVTYAG